MTTKKGILETSHRKSDSLGFISSIFFLSTTSKTIWMNKGAVLASATGPWHWLFFCPVPQFGAHFLLRDTWVPFSKDPFGLSFQYILLEFVYFTNPPKWHWLILSPISALVNETGCLTALSLIWNVILSFLIFIGLNLYSLYCYKGPDRLIL